MGRLGVCHCTPCFVATSLSLPRMDINGGQAYAAQESQSSLYHGGGVVWRDSSVSSSAVGNPSLVRLSGNHRIEDETPHTEHKQGSVFAYKRPSREESTPANS